VDFQIGCCTPEEVRQNVANVIAAFGERSDKEDQVLREVKDILRPIQGQTWPSGLPENNWRLHRKPHDLSHTPPPPEYQTKASWKGTVCWVANPMTW